MDSRQLSLWSRDRGRLVRAEHGGNTHDLSGVDGEAWAGQGSMGPFLRTGDMFTDRLTLVNGEDAHPHGVSAQPEPAVVDDLQPAIRLKTGRFCRPTDCARVGSHQLNSTPMWWTQTTQRRFRQATRPSSVLTSAELSLRFIVHRR